MTAARRAAGLSWPVAALLALALVVAWPSGAAAELRPAGQAPPGAMEVTVGIVPITIFGLDVGNATYRMDAYIWFRWRGDHDPSRSFEIINAVDKGRHSRIYTYPEPKVQPDGGKYQVLRVEGYFHQRFDLTAFPLDAHELTLLIEDQELNAGRLVYRFDAGASRLGDLLTIGNWRILGLAGEELVHDWGSDFGDVTSTSEYAMLKIAVGIERPAKYFIWKMLLPILIVVVAHWGALLLHPRLEARVTLPATALLAAVVLQQAFAGSLPEVGYLVLIDKIFVLTFGVIVLTGIRTVYTATLARQHEAQGGDAAYYTDIRRGDLLVLAAETAVFVAGVALLIWLR